ncbi:ATP-binding protein [Candidatus Avelusimicrobium faecicola]|uniref:ATP-binding protein n=1 Tax=Candidatus Avelusimicrobium faecicola TaxID=3416205 RepID=UPI003D13AACD
MINRPDYIEKLSKFIDVPIIKILVGLRRSGKSTILEMIQNELRSRGIDNQYIIVRNYTEVAYSGFTAKEMLADIQKSLTNKGKYYLFLDELQEIDGWEKVVNQLMEQGNTDIYVTGSNSKLMSGEISTYLSGRYVSIPVYTLSFKEYIVFNKGTTLSTQELLEQYIKLGGFPLIAANKLDERTTYQITQDIYNAIVTNDILRRHRLNKQDLFDRVVRFILDNMGKTFSANAIVKFLRSEHRKVSVETIYNYLKWLEQAFIIHKCQRYDVLGKAILKTQEKYYLGDISLKYGLMGYNATMLPSVIENIVYLELCRRGYAVHIGKNQTKEIDFIAQKQNEKLYIQICVNFPPDSTRETDNLLAIEDNYPKYVITLDKLAVGNINGIEIMHLADFLLK